MKRRFYMYSAWERPMSKLTDEQLGKFLRIYYQMQLTGDTDVDSEDPMVDMMLEVVREQVTFDVQAYDRKCAVNKENGAKSHQTNPEEPKQTQTVPNGVDSDSDTEIDSEIEPEIGIDSERLRCGESKKRKRFIAPTIEEVEAYSMERNSRVNVEKFFDYYTANGWVQGKGKPIKDWKAAFRNWERRDEEERPKGNVVELTKGQQARAAQNEVLKAMYQGLL